MNLQSLLGNFALILFVLMVITGVIWCLDVLVWAKQRRAKADVALAEFDARVAKLNGEGIKSDITGRGALQEKLLRQPTWIEYSGSFFPVIAAVFFLRSFLYEPFKIPSSSMVPTLVIGDLILVNKYTYGIRLPIVNKKIISINDPQRGDVMVFKYPKDPSMDYIKRVVGLPGDKILYQDDENLAYYKQWQENLTGVEHKIITDDRAPNFVPNPDAFPQHELCSYNAEGFACTVPPGHYFMMGDNRDNSLDSRYWGFVPDENIVGKAFFVWMNLSNLKRIGGFQ